MQAAVNREAFVCICSSDIKSIVEGPTCTLVETVAEKIASRTLERNPLVNSITVTVRKPHVAVVGPVDYLGEQGHAGPGI